MKNFFSLLCLKIFSVFDFLPQIWMALWFSSVKEIRSNGVCQFKAKTSRIIAHFCLLCGILEPLSENVQDNLEEKIS